MASYLQPRHEGFPTVDDRVNEDADTLYGFDDEYLGSALKLRQL